MTARPRWSRILAVVGGLLVVLALGVIVREALRGSKRVTPPTINPGDLNIYANSPIVGPWKEVARIPCDGGPEYEPFDPIMEFGFTASGEFSLTQVPLETRTDYSGMFEVDDLSKRLRMYHFRGTFPADLDGEGHYEIDPDTGELVLRGMWLNPRMSLHERQQIPIACGHRFARRISDDWTGALHLTGDLDGRKDSSRQVRPDGSFETLRHCRQLIQGSDYGEYMLRERMTVGSPEPVEVNFIRLADKGDGEVLLTIYDPVLPDNWFGSCDASPGRHKFLTYPERGEARCSLRLFREGQGDNEVWTGTSKIGDCKSDREGDAYMIVQMRIDKDAVELWERGYDQHGQQTWGADAPTRFEPARDAWPEPLEPVPTPVVDTSSLSPAARLLAFIAGSGVSTAPESNRQGEWLLSKARYTTCPVEISDAELPEDAELLAMNLTLPWGFHNGEELTTFSYVLVAHPQGELLALDMVPLYALGTCDRKGRQISDRDMNRYEACTVVFRTQRDGSYVGNTIGSCALRFSNVVRAEIDMTVRDGELDYWQRWYDREHKQVGGPASGPIQFRRESAP